MTTPEDILCRLPDAIRERARREMVQARHAARHDDRAQGTAADAAAAVLARYAAAVDEADRRAAKAADEFIAPDARKAEADRTRAMFWAKWEAQSKPVERVTAEPILRRAGGASLNGGEAVALFEVHHGHTVAEAAALLGGSLLPAGSTDPDICLRQGGLIDGVRLRQPRPIAPVERATAEDLAWISGLRPEYPMGSDDDVRELMIASKKLAAEVTAAGGTLTALGHADDGKGLAERIRDLHAETMGYLGKARSCAEVEGAPEPVTTSYTRAQLAAAVDEAHTALHEWVDAAGAPTPGEVDAINRAHEALHRVGAGQERIACATPDPEAQRLYADIRAIGEREMPCGHKVEDLVYGGPDLDGRPAVAQCGQCLTDRQAWKAQQPRTPESVLRAMLRAYEQAAERAHVADMRASTAATRDARSRAQRANDVVHAMLYEHLAGWNIVGDPAGDTVLTADYQARMRGDRPLDAPPAEV
jgi:hypothetical protein